MTAKRRMARMMAVVFFAGAIAGCGGNSTKAGALGSDGGGTGSATGGKTGAGTGGNTADGTGGNGGDGAGGNGGDGTGGGGPGGGTAVRNRQQFMADYASVICAAYRQLCACDFSNPGACTSEHTKAAVAVYYCVTDRATCEAPAKGCMFDHPNRAFNEMNDYFCKNDNLSGSNCAKNIMMEIGGGLLEKPPGFRLGNLWDRCLPRPTDAGQLIQACQTPDMGPQPEP